MSAAVRLSKHLQSIARRLGADLDGASGEHVLFTLVCWGPGIANYISNTERADVVKALREVVAYLEADTPDIPLHLKQ